MDGKPSTGEILGSSEFCDALASWNLGVVGWASVKGSEKNYVLGKVWSGYKAHGAVDSCNLVPVGARICELKLSGSVIWHENYNLLPSVKATTCNRHDTMVTSHDYLAHSC